MPPEPVPEATRATAADGKAEVWVDTPDDASYHDVSEWEFMPAVSAAMDVQVRGGKLLCPVCGDPMIITRQDGDEQIWHCPRGTADQDAVNVELAAALERAEGIEDA